MVSEIGNTSTNHLLSAGVVGAGIAIGAVGLRFYSWRGEIGHSVVNGSTPLRRFLETVSPSR